MDDRTQQVEAAAQLIHEDRHRMGSAQVCGACRALAERIDALYRAMVKA